MWLSLIWMLLRSHVLNFIKLPSQESRLLCASQCWPHTESLQTPVKTPALGLPPTVLFVSNWPSSSRCIFKALQVNKRAPRVQTSWEPVLWEVLQTDVIRPKVQVPNSKINTQAKSHGHVWASLYTCQFLHKGAIIESVVHRRALWSLKNACVIVPESSLDFCQDT